MSPAEVARAVEALLRRELDLRPLPLAPELAELRGEFRGAPAVLTTRAYSGERVRYARFAALTGAGLSIGNLLVVPAPAFATPIFGADLVGAGADSALLAADLSPTSPVASARAERALRAVHVSLADLPSAGALPGWAARCFSAAPLFVRVPAARLELAATAVEALARWFAADLRGAAADDAGAADTDGATRDYMAAHLDDAMTLGMLAKIFQAGPADRFARVVLFPRTFA